MTVDAETEAMLTKESGMVPMKTENGIHALYRGWAANTSQIMVTEGYAAKIRAFLKNQRMISRIRAAKRKKRQVLQQAERTCLQKNRAFLETCAFGSNQTSCRQN